MSVFIKMDMNIVTIVMASIFLIANVVDASCPICGGGNQILEDELSDVRDLTIQWLADQQQNGGGWPSANTQNAILGLQLADPKWLSGLALDERLLTKERLEYELLQELLPAICDAGDGGDDNNGVTDCVKNSGCCAKRFSRGAGVLGQYMLALQSVCCPSDDFYGADLECTMISLLKDFTEPNFNNFFQFSLSIISLCSSDASILRKALVTLADGSDRNNPCSDGIDILSMEVMAMVCARDQAIDKGLTDWDEIIDDRVQCILSTQNDDKSFGNAISTALAIQALTAADSDPADWFCETTVAWLLDQQTEGDFGGVGATAQILPFFGCNNFGSLRNLSIDCPNFGTPPFIMPGDSTVTFDLKVSFRGNPANATYTVTILDGESLFFGIIRLADSDTGFTFQTQPSAFGEYILSINGVTSSFEASLYWGIYVIENGITSSANAGVEGLFPSDGDSYLFGLTFYGK